jgi:hypothetical protein
MKPAPPQASRHSWMVSLAKRVVMALMPSALVSSWRFSASVTGWPRQGCRVKPSSW